MLDAMGIIGGTVIAAVVGMLACGASGLEISYDLDYTISASDPAGAAPWLTATFDDGGSTGTVYLTLETTNLTGGEYVSQWMFNVNPDLASQLGDLQFDLTVLSGTFDAPVVTTGENAYKADGDGYFDIKIDFSEEDGGMAHRFNAGDSAMYTISGISSLAADSFDFISVPGGGAGEYITAAHVQGIGENSGWVSTPEPGTLSLLAVGAAALLRRRRR